MNARTANLWIIWIVLLLIAGCQSRPDPAEVVLGAAKGFDSGDIDAAKLDASLAYYADDAVVHLVGLPPDQPAHFAGKGAIRAWWEGLAEQHFNLELEVLKVEGDTVTTRTLTWMNWSRQAGIAPIVATEVYVIQGGKITSETWTLSEESKAKMMAALAPTAAAPASATVATARPTATRVAATRAPTAVPATATLAPGEAAVADIRDVAGVWAFMYRGDRYLIEFNPDRTYRVGAPGDPGGIAVGTYVVVGGQLQFLTSEFDCTNAQKARYEVFVNWQGGAAAALRFESIGRDDCPTRRESLDRKTLSPGAP